MTSELKDSKVLLFNPNVLQDVRKGHGFDHPGMCQAIDILIEWAKKQEHFVDKDFNRDYLERVIITTKGSIELAKKRIDKMCTLRTALPECFDKFDAAHDFPGLQEDMITAVLPKQTEDNCRIHVVQFKSNHKAAETLMEAFKFTILMSEYIRKTDYSDGVYVIFDMRKIKILSYVQSFSPSDFRKMVALYMDGYGFRVKAIYTLSSSKNIDTFINIIRPLLGAKVGQRVQVLPDLESLYKHLPKRLLPEDYDGEQESLMKISDNWTEVLSSEEHVIYMKDAVQFRTNESKRRADKFNEEYLGMPGTFKMLNVD